MPTTVTIDRTSLTLPALVIAGSRAAAAAASGFWLPGDGLQVPGFTPRRTYAPDSAYVGGKQLLAAVLEQSTLPLVVRVTAADQAALTAKRTELEAALSQFVYQITLDIDGATETWSADYSWPQWTTPDARMRADIEARAAVVIPVNPT